MNTTLGKNQIYEAEITGMTAQGSGVARIHGQAVFVARAALGDLLRVRIVKVMKHYAFGIIEEILLPSPDRVENDCPSYPRCGGCVFRHVSYEAELRYKHQIVADALRRIGGISVTPEPVRAGAPARYRNKAQYPVGRVGDKTVAGFYEARSHRIVEIPDCRLVPEEFAGITSAVEEWISRFDVSIYDEKTGQGLLRHVFIRKGFETGEVLLCLVVNGDSLPHEEALCAMAREAHPLTGIVLNSNTVQSNVILGNRERILWGRPFVRDRLLGLDFEISPRSFYQVNPVMTAALYEKAAEFAGLSRANNTQSAPEFGDKVLLDLYCGIGSIGLSMARQVGRIIGIEISPEAVANAKANAARNGIHHAEFYCMDAVEAADFLREQSIRPDIVLLDPPRKGLEDTLPVLIANELAPERIVYISCEPSTLARDLKRFEELGYQTTRVAPFDLFPHTGHVECVVLIMRNM